MRPTQAGFLMKSARHALRRGALKTRDIALLDCLLFSCRAPGLWATSVSLRQLAKLAGMCRQSVVDGLRRLEALGLLVREKTRQRVGWASRQGTNRYRFHTGSTPQPAYREQVYIIDPKSPLEQALNRLQAALPPDG